MRLTLFRSRTAGSPRASLAARIPLYFGLAQILAVAGLAGWLFHIGEATVKARQEQIPYALVEVVGTPPGQGEAARNPAVTALPAPRLDGPVVLTPAPQPSLVEESPIGPLPRIGLDGRTPWQTYARPFPAEESRPRIAIVMADMGLSGAITATAIQKLPGGVTLAFVPYAENLVTWVEKARADGHEAILAVPMEPRNYPRDDPGPNTLLTSVGLEKNLERLNWALSRVAGYIGVTTLSGSRFLDSSGNLMPVLETLKKRGLLFLDTKVTGTIDPALAAAQLGVPFAVVDRMVDRDPARGAIDDELRTLEETAKRKGMAVGLGLPFPTTLERLVAWLPTLHDKGFVLAPLSAVANRQKFE